MRVVFFALCLNEKICLFSFLQTLSLAYCKDYETPCKTKHAKMLSLNLIRDFEEHTMNVLLAERFWGDLKAAIHSFPFAHPQLHFSSTTVVMTINHEAGARHAHRFLLSKKSLSGATLNRNTLNMPSKCEKAQRTA